MSDYTPQPPSHPPTKSPSVLKTVPMWIWVTVGVLIVALVVLFTLVFTGGDDNKDSESAPTPAPTVTVTEKPEPAPEPAPKRETGPTLEATIPDNIQTKEGFSNFVRDMFPVLEGVPDEVITDRAERACIMLDEGATFLEVIEDSVSTAKSADEAEAFGGIVGGAIPVLCPEHSDELEPYL